MEKEPEMKIAGKEDVRVRFYIPFYVENQTFSDISEAFSEYYWEEERGGKKVKKKYWDKKDFPLRNHAHLYDHVLNLMNVHQNANTICRTWAYKRSLTEIYDAQGTSIPCPYLFEYDGWKLEFSISSVYVHLFTTCIGILSFDLVLDRTTLGDSVEKLIIFMNLIKKVSYEDNNHVFLLTGNKSITMHKGENAAQIQAQNMPVSIPQNTLYFKEDTKHARCIYFQKKRTRLSDLFADILHNTDDQIRFFDATNEAIRPDQALMCSYFVYCNAENEDLQKIAYRLARGYDDKYLISDNMLRDSQQLFDNVFYCNKMEGSSIAVAPSEMNQGFFVNHVELLLETYSFIYLIVLYQHYSLLAFSRRVANDLPSDAHLYLENSTYADKMEQIIVEVHTFLMKSDFATISSVQHHNEFFANCKNALYIDEDIQSLRSGFEYLEDIQGELKQIEHEKQQRLEKEKQEKLRQDELTRNGRLSWLISLLSLITFLKNGYDVVNLAINVIRDFQNGHSSQHLIPLIVYFALLVTVGILFVIHLRKLRKSRRQG